MSADEPGRGPNLEVDPSERNDQRSAPKPEKDKDKDAAHKDKDAPSASSKGINPVQHSE